MDPRIEGEALNASEVILDRLIRRQLLTLRAASGLARDQLRQLDADVLREIIGQIVARLPAVPDYGHDTTAENSRRLGALYDSLDETIGEGFEMLRKAAQSELLALARSEVRWAKGVLGSVLPSKIDLYDPSPDYLRAVVRSRPFQGRLLKDWYGDLAESTRRRVKSEVQQGLQAGESTQIIARRLTGTKANGYADGALAITRRQAEGVVRTAANHVGNAAREATWAANGDLIKGVRWVSTLDSRTTLTCAALDGQVFPLDQGPRPPAHFGCRSATTPVLRTWREMGIDLDEIPASTRASLNGQVPADLDFEAWLRRQDRAFQLEYLGQGRFELWQSGKTVRDLVTASWKPIAVSALG